MLTINLTRPGTNWETCVSVVCEVFPGRVNWEAGSLLRVGKWWHLSSGDPCRRRHEDTQLCQPVFTSSWLGFLSPLIFAADIRTQVSAFDCQLKINNSFQEFSMLSESDQDCRGGQAHRLSHCYILSLSITETDIVRLLPWSGFVFLQKAPRSISWEGKGLFSLHFCIAVHHQRKSE